jgi:hypothetical protein
VNNQALIISPWNDGPRSIRVTLGSRYVVHNPKSLTALLQVVLALD